MTANTDPRLINWDDAEFTEARPGIFGSTFHTPQLTVVMYRYSPGSTWEEHSHPQDQITTVLEGQIDFTVNGRIVRLSAGESAALPGETPHAATIPSDGACVTVNVLTSRSGPPPPPRA